MASLNAGTELLTEHFGYPPVSLLDDIINSVNILAERALNSVEQALLRQPPASLGFRPPRKTGKHQQQQQQQDKEAAEAAAAEAHRHEVENGTHQLETLLCASIDRNFDKFEIYVMRNILCVRPEDRDWMRLAHYEGLDFSAVGEGEEEEEEEGENENENENENEKENGNKNKKPPSDAALARLHRRLQASLQLGSLLDAETARNEAMLAQLRMLTGRSDVGAMKEKEKEKEQSPDPRSLGFLLDRGPLTESDVATPLTTTTAFALSQLPALRQLSGELRQMAPMLASEDEGEEEQERRRREANKRKHGEGSGPSGPSGPSDPSGPSSWRRERLAYVEGATRKHLERSRGLGLELDERGRDQPPSKTSRGGGEDAAIEPESLTNILGILRENKRPAKRGAAATASAAADEEPSGDAMDES